MTTEQKQQIYELRLQGLGYKAIGALLGLSRDSVRGYCKRNGLDGYVEVVELNAQISKKNNVLCSQCGVSIQQKIKGRQRKFCSDECRRKWWNDNPERRTKRETAFYNFECEYCGKKFTAYGNAKRKYCSHRCYIIDRFGGVEDEF